MKKKILSRDITAVGIDVAKATLSVCYRSNDGTETALTLRNTDTDIRKKLISRLSGFQGRIVMESTGHYHWLSALLLSEAGYDVRVVNPILAKQYTSSNIRKVKTDAMDASGLARMAEIADNLPESFRMTREALSLRKKLSLIAGLSHNLQRLKSTAKQLGEAHASLKDEPSNGEGALDGSIASLSRTIQILEDEFIEEAKQIEGDPDPATHLDTIPGVTPFLAHVVLHWFERLPNLTAKSWIGYAGLDVSSRESGTWHGRCRLTKRGNSDLRRRLYSAAWGASMSDPDFKAYYAYLREEGRSHVESVLIIGRKIIRIMFNVLEKNQPYDPSLFSFGTASQELST
jgi:transposase